MDWHQIKYFQTVAKVQHFTKAAEELAISQPGLSRSIAKLEEELEVQLFDRRGRNIYLNRFGKMFLKRVENAIQQIENGKKEIWDEIHPNIGNISLSFLPSLGIDLVPDLISTFQKDHPEVTFQLTQASNQEIIDELKAGATDVAFITFHHEDEALVYKQLLNEPLFLVVSYDHPIATFEEVHLHEVKNEPFISFKDSNVLHNIIEDLCNDAGFSPHIVFKAEDIGTVSGLVGANLGVSLVPDIKVVNKNKVKLIRVKEPNCSREIGMAYVKDSYLSPVVNNFIQFIHQHFNDH